MSGDRPWLTACGCAGQVVRTMSSYWQQSRKIYGEWRFDLWLEVTRWRLRLRDERRSRSFDQIHMFADDAKPKLQHRIFFVALKNNCFSTESVDLRHSLCAMAAARRIPVTDLLMQTLNP
ncbi:MULTISPECIES: hypothetical protein [unclassified Caballeronia]|uniref:hypothetical protein n=1 Tax=unclassified Caballeronia TaxID=2646786 RepID=UPI0013ECB116|nr:MULTISPECIES: hypothetical protein [unclassified Caballeronia]